MIDIKTALKLAKIAVERYSELNSQPGFIITQNGQKIKVRFTELAEALELLSTKDLVVVRRCEDCENWCKSPKAKSGHCFPKEYNRTRQPNDFCSAEYLIRSKESRYIDEAVRKKLQKE